jgi:hypothetical protein
MPEGVVDERGFNLMRRMREEAGKGLTLGAFKKLLREQFFMLLLDERRAIEAIPTMLAKDPPFADRMAGKLRQLIDVVGLTSSEAKVRFAEVETFFKHGVISEGPTGEPEKKQLEAVRSARSHAAGSSKH